MTLAIPKTAGVEENEIQFIAKWALRIYEQVNKWENNKGIYRYPSLNLFCYNYWTFKILFVIGKYTGISIE